jgi:lysophospholipase L1-like esterase
MNGVSLVLLVALAQPRLELPRIAPAPLPPPPSGMSAAPPAPARAVPPLPDPRPVVVPPTVEGLVPLERPETLSRFFDALGALETNAPVRVRATQLGDSHIAADMWSGRLRVLLQQRFGDGGRGFVSAGRPWPSYSQAHVRTSQTGRWRVDGLRGGMDDGRSGPATCSVASADPAATVTLSLPQKSETARTFSRLDVHYLRQPAGACVALEVDGQPLAVLDTRGPWTLPGATAFDLPDAPHRVVARPLAPSGGGEARLLGFSLERSRGLLWDALGINGAQARRLLREHPGALEALLTRLDPRLLVLSYGTNEIYDRRLVVEDYARQLDAVLTRVRAAAPQADCLLTGPFDALQGRRSPTLFEPVYAVQRQLAERHGCAFWDARRAMGGPGSIRGWRRKGWAQKDNVHLTRPGYEALGDHLAAALLDAYARRPQP